MGRMLLGAVAAILVAVSYPAYADDYAASVQDVIDAWTDLRNNYLAESFFGESYPTPEMGRDGDGGERHRVVRSYQG